MPRVAESDVHAQPVVSDGARLRCPDGGEQPRPREAVETTEHPDANRLERECVELRRDDLEERLDLALVPLEILPGQRPERDLVDPDLGAPGEQVVDLVGAVAVARPDVAEPELVAQRRFPSRITATWWGTGSWRTWCRRSRSVYRR